jgi:hypothetical protein
MTESNKSCPGLQVVVESRQDENAQPTTTMTTAFTTPSTPSYYRPFSMTPVTPTLHTPSHYHPR